MKTYVPAYYTKFSCKAKDCRHSCCIGWEIGIDKDSLGFYKNINTSFGEKLRKNIAEDADGAHFQLCGGDRCPFLNDDNLCDIYINLGEDALCQICSDHPRFRNYIRGRCEMRLGLCCEAACELILSADCTDWLLLDDDGEENTAAPSEWENELDAKRSEVTAILQDRRKTVDERVHEILDMLGANNVWFGRTASEWREFYLSLEMLDSTWGEALGKLDSARAETCSMNDIIWENLLMYFVNRHVTNAADEWDFTARLSFAILSCAVIRTISRGGDFHDICESARMYSSEIEYSEDNTDALLDELF